MDELNDSLVAVEISKSPDNASRTHRDELIAKADSERELGCYSKALGLYREAEAIEANLSISIKIAGLLTEQGRSPLALKEWNTALSRFASEEEDREMVAVAELCRGICEGTMDLKFRRALDMGLKYFQEYVQPHPVKEWKGRKVRPSRGSTRSMAHLTHRHISWHSSWSWKPRMPSSRDQAPSLTRFLGPKQ